jgi:hypothetical protein
MALKQRGLSISLVLILLLGAFSSPVAASELTDAQARYQELEKSYLSEMEYLIVFLEHDESQAKSCVAQYELSTVQEEVALKQGCQSQLTRLQSERAVRTERANSIKEKMDSAAIELEKLKASSGGSVSTGSGASAGGSTTTSDSGSSASQSSSPAANSSTQTSDPQSSQSTSDTSATASPAPTPTPAQNSDSQAATTAPTPRSSPSPTAVSGSKVSATPKPVVKKKKTITCVKGKVTRKVTAVKPVCPKGFKIRKK